MCKQETYFKYFSDFKQYVFTFTNIAFELKCANTHFLSLNALVKMIFEWLDVHTNV